MVEPSREVLGATAISLVEPNDIQAGPTGFVGNAPNVVGFTRAFEPVQHEQRGMEPWLRLPVALAKDACVDADVEISGRRRGQARQLARMRPRVQGHTVASPPPSMWDERLHISHRRLAPVAHCRMTVLTSLLTVDWSM